MGSLTARSWPRWVRTVLLAVTVLTAVVVAFPGVAAAQNGAAPVLGDNGTDYSKIYEQCKAAAAQGNEPGTAVDQAINGVLRSLGADAVANGVNAANCVGQGFTTDPMGAVSTAAGNAASAFWGDPIGDFVKSLLEGNSQALLVIMSLWQKTPFQGSSIQSAVAGMFNMTYQLQFLLLAVSLMVAGTRMAVARNRGLGDGMEDVGGVMMKFILAGVALPTVVVSLHMATDALSNQWIQLGVPDPKEQISAVTTLNESTGLGPALVLILVVWALLGALAQFVALVLRDGLLIVVVGLIPLAAASSALHTGKQAYKQMTVFIVAALLFKPVASLVYVVVFWLASKNDASVLEAISAMILLGAAGFTLPALMRIVAPVATAAVAGGSASAIGGTVAGATGAIAGGVAGAAHTAASSVGSAASGQNSSSYGGQYSSPIGAVGPPGSSGTGPSSAGATASGATAGTSSRPQTGQAGGASGAQPSGASAATPSKMAGLGAVASAGAGAALTGVAGVAGGVAKVAAHGARASATTESMIAGALGNYHGQVR